MVHGRLPQYWCKNYVKNIIVSFFKIKLGPLQIRLKSAPLELLLSLEPHENSCWFIAPEWIP